MTQDNSNSQIGDSYWAALVARVLHPAHVEIIEALRWIDRPLTGTDLVGVLQGQRVGLRIERRLQQLARLGAVAPEDKGETRAPVRQRAYRLVKRQET
jgi:hypothetical protein